MTVVDILENCRASCRALIDCDYAHAIGLIQSSHSFIEEINDHVLRNELETFVQEATDYVLGIADAIDSTQLKEEVLRGLMDGETRV